MSTSLTIYFLRDARQLSETSVLCYNQLSFISDYSIFGQIIDMSSLRMNGREDIPERPMLKQLPLPPQLWVDFIKENGILHTRTNRSGGELNFMYAQEFKKLKLPAQAHPFNRAIMAFINALPDDTPIILDWSY